MKRHNPIFEQFNLRKQEVGESVDYFIMALYCLEECCDYRELHVEMMRDGLVVGLSDASLSERLKMDPDLTLEKVILGAHQNEAVKKQQTVVRGTENLATSIDNIQ